MTPRSYVTAGSVSELRARLDRADWAVVRDVERMRLASTLDLQRMAGLRGPAPVRQFRRRLQRLYEWQVLDRLERRVGGVRAGSTAWVYVLGLAGQRLVDSRGGSSVRRAWTPRPSWLNHALAASHLFVVLREAEAAKRLRLLSFEPEPLCWRPGLVDGGLLKPDLFVHLEVGSELVSAFVEVDCATESPTTIARKCEAYREYWQAGTEQSEHGVFPEVLWLVPTPARQRVIERVAAREPGGADQLHRVRLYDEAIGAFIEPP